jgi:uncharacterized protein YjeT (DUF2065 family)
MPAKRIIGIVLIVAGAVLLWQGWEARQSVGSRISQALQGSPSSQALWLLAIGAVLVVVGVVVSARH